MQMKRDSEASDVLEYRRDLKGVEQLAGDIRKDLKAMKAKLFDTTVRFLDRSFGVAKTKAAQPDKLAWIF